MTRNTAISAQSTSAAAVRVPILPTECEVQNQFAAALDGREAVGVAEVRIVAEFVPRRTRLLRVVGE